MFIINSFFCFVTVFEFDLLVSVMKSSINFTCVSQNNSILWERSPGVQIYRPGRTDPSRIFGNRLVVDDSHKPTYVLTLVESQMSDNGTYLCREEAADYYIKSLELIILGRILNT